MAQTLNLKFEDFRKALSTLEEALAEEENEFIRDSVIKRFEYSFELCWKTTKLFLNEMHGIDAFSPKDCFRELRKIALISDEETEELLQMADERNQIVHRYDEDFSDELFRKIKGRYFNLLKEIYNNLLPQE